MSKRWDEMDREELLIEKGLWESRMQELKLQLDAAKRRAYVDKVYLPPAEFQAMEGSRVRLAAGLRGIQTQLALRKRKPFNSYFYAAADELIEDAALFERIYDLAEKLMTADNKKVAVCKTL